MNAKGPFNINTLPVQLTLVVLGASLGSLKVQHIYHFSLSKILILWICTVIFGGLLIVAIRFGITELDRREKEFYQRTGQKKTE